MAQAPELSPSTHPYGITAATGSVIRIQTKPDWVARELVRIKAWSPEMGCRLIAEIFNRRFAERRVSVGKTYVAKVLRQRKLEVLRMRRTLKHRVP